MLDVLVTPQQESNLARPRPVFRTSNTLWVRLRSVRSAHLHSAAPKGCSTKQRRVGRRAARFRAGACGAIYRKIFTPPSVAVDSNGNSTWAYYSHQQTRAVLQLKKFDSKGAELGHGLPLTIFDSDLDVHLLQDDFLLVGGISLNTTSGQVMMFQISSNRMVTPWTDEGSNVYEWYLPFDTPVAEDQSHVGKSYITPDKDGNLIMVFPYASFNLAQKQWKEDEPRRDNIGILKISPSGNGIWFRKIEGKGDEIPTGLVMDSNGDFLITGYSNGNTVFGENILTNTSGFGDNGANDGFVTRISSEGEFLWAKKLSGVLEDKVEGISEAKNGTFWVFGSFFGDVKLGDAHFTSGRTNCYACEVNKEGQVLRSIQIPARVKRVVQAPNGDLIIAGLTSGNTFLPGNIKLESKGGDDIFVASYSFSQGYQWAATFGYYYDDIFNDLILSGIGEIYLSGTARGGLVYGDNYVPSTGTDMPFLAKLSSNLIPAPIIIRGPISTNTYLGGLAVLSVTLENSIETTYQWYFNDSAIPGATNESYTIRSVGKEDVGFYSVEVRNNGGTVRSTPALLSLAGFFPVEVTTLNGKPDAGYVDSYEKEEVRYNHPVSIAEAGPGLIAVADEWNHVIREVNLTSGAASTLAGTYSRGYLNGTGREARFNYPAGIIQNRDGDIIVAEYGNSVIRLIYNFGERVVSTLAGSGTPGYLNGNAPESQFNHPTAMVLATNGIIYATELSNHTVRYITPNGIVATLAGNGSAGYADGFGTNAQFNAPAGITIGSDGNFYVTEMGGNRIRRVTSAGMVTTVAGTNIAGFQDSQGGGARFNRPIGITADPFGNLFVSDAGNHAIRKVDPIGNVLTIAGTGTPGFLDGNESIARFNFPSGILWHSSGCLYVADTLNNSLRKISFTSTTNSPPARLTVALNPVLTIYGEQGKTYRIESAVETEPFDWLEVGQIFMTNSIQLWYDQQPAIRQKRLYRVEKLN